MEKKNCKIKNKRIIAYKLKMHGNQVRRQNPRQRHQKLVDTFSKCTKCPSSKTLKSECRIPQRFCFVILLYNFQFVKEEIFELK